MEIQRDKGEGRSQGEGKKTSGREGDKGKVFETRGEEAKLQIVGCSDKFVGTALVPTNPVGTACGNSCSHKFVGTDYLVFQ